MNLDIASTKMDKISKALVILFILSIPMMPIFTIRIHYLLGIICVTIYCIQLIKNKIFTKLNIFELMYLLFIIYSFFRVDSSIEGSISRTLDKYKSDAYFIIKTMLFNIGCLACSIRILYEENKDINKTINTVGNTFVIGTIIVSIFCIFYEYFIIGDLQRLGTYLFAEEYGTRIAYTHDITIAVFFVVYNIFINKKCRKKYVAGLLFLIAMIMLSGTRKLLIALLLFIAIYQGFNNNIKFKTKVKYVISFIVILPIIYLIMIKVGFIYDFIGYRFESIVQEVFYDNGKDSSSSQRDRMINKALEYFDKHPIIGIGTVGFKFRFERNTGIFKYSHNNYLELLANEGIIGGILYYTSILVILIVIIYTKYKDWKELDRFFIASILTILVLDFWNVSYYRVQFILIYELAGLFFLLKQEEQNTEMYLNNLKNEIKKTWEMLNTPIKKSEMCKNEGEKSLNGEEK